VGTEQEIRKALPLYLRHICFAGHAWKLLIVPEKGNIPLFIANAPVVLLIPRYYTRIPQPNIMPRPEDPFNGLLNSLEVLPHEAVTLALTIFPGAHGFFVLFDGSFVIAYPEGVDCDAELQYLPETFGGLRVMVVNRPGITSIMATSSKGKEKKVLSSEVPVLDMDSTGTDRLEADSWGTTPLDIGSSSEDVLVLFMTENSLLALVLSMWADQEKRAKIRAVVDSLQFIKPRVLYADQVFCCGAPEKVQPSYFLIE
jgi:hypothetical protein